MNYHGLTWGVGGESHKINHIYFVVALGVLLDLLEWHDSLEKICLDLTGYMMNLLQDLNEDGGEMHSCRFLTTHTKSGDQVSVFALI